MSEAQTSKWQMDVGTAFAPGRFGPRIVATSTYSFWWYRSCRHSSSNSSHKCCMRASSSSDAIARAMTSSLAAATDNH